MNVGSDKVYPKQDILKEFVVAATDILKSAELYEDIEKARADKKAGIPTPIDSIGKESGNGSLMMHELGFNPSIVYYASTAEGVDYKGRVTEALKNNLTILFARGKDIVEEDGATRFDSFNKKKEEAGYSIEDKLKAVQIVYGKLSSGRGIDGKDIAILSGTINDIEEFIRDDELVTADINKFGDRVVDVGVGKKDMDLLNNSVAKLTQDKDKISDESYEQILLQQEELRGLNEKNFINRYARLEENRDEVIRKILEDSKKVSRKNSTALALSASKKEPFLDKFKDVLNYIDPMSILKVIPRLAPEVTKLAVDITQGIGRGIHVVSQELGNRTENPFWKNFARVTSKIGEELSGGKAEEISNAMKSIKKSMGENAKTVDEKIKNEIIPAQLAKCGDNTDCIEKLAKNIGNWRHYTLTTIALPNSYDKLVDYDEFVSKNMSAITFAQLEAVDKLVNKGTRFTAPMPSSRPDNRQNTISEAEKNFAIQQAAKAAERRH